MIHIYFNFNSTKNIKYNTGIMKEIKKENKNNYKIDNINSDTIDSLKEITYIKSIYNYIFLAY